MPTTECPMQDLNDLYYFAQVVEHGGFAAASRIVGIPKSKLSRRILELEDRLGVRLLQRSTRKLAVTDIGQAYYRHCVAMLAEADAAQEVIDQSQAGPRGTIRISAPPALICFRLAPVVARYMVDNPRVRIELLSTPRPVDLIGEGVDLAIRVRFPPLEKSDFVMRRLGDSAQRLVASPMLCKGLDLPLRPSDLAGLPSLSLDQPNRDFAWTLTGPDGAEARIPQTPRLVTDDMPQLLSAAIAGVGVVQLPDMVADRHIASGELVEIIQGWTPVSGVIHALFPTRRGLLPSIRSFIDFLVASFSDEAGGLAGTAREA